MIYPNVTIRERTRIGERVIIHSGTVIGSDGFGFEMAAGGHKKVPQIGIVQIDNDVEIGANTTIDRARFGRTWIQEGVKIDNLVQIAHNVVIGKHSIIVAQVGIAGSVRIGSGVVIGGQAGIIGHIEIDDGTMIGAQTGVSKSLHGGTWWATPGGAVKGGDAASRLGAAAGKALRAGQGAGEKGSVAQASCLRVWRASRLPNLRHRARCPMAPQAGCLCYYVALPYVSLGHEEDLPAVGIFHLLAGAIACHIHIAAVFIERAEDIAGLSRDRFGVRQIVRRLRRSGLLG